jgi:hypothetical protein
MCANCLSTFDVVVSQGLAAVAILKRPVQARLATAGWVAPIDVLGDNANAVAFLRSLDLDPVEILGSDVVDAAASWTPAPWTRRRVALRLRPAT